MWLFRIGWCLLFSPVVLIPALGWTGVPLALMAMTGGIIVTHYATRWRLRRTAYRGA